MGSPASPILADIFLGEIVDELNNNFTIKYGCKL